MSEEPRCALRALNICDGDLVVDYQRAVAHGAARRHCYCSMLATSPRSEVGQELRTARARTVTRAAQLQRLIERLDRLTDDPPERPPF